MIHLHVHTDHTGFDGFRKPAAFIKRALEMRHDAIATTEHGTLRGIHDFDKAAQRLGIRPIFGVELYVIEDMAWRGFSKEEIKEITKGTPYRRRREILKAEEERRGLTRQHLTLLAMNETGLRNLYRLTSIAWLEGFHWRPCVDLPTFWKHSEGLIVLSGCMVGPVSLAVNQGRTSDAIALAEEFQERLGDRFYLEIMPHDLDELRVANEALYEIGEALGIPAVATQDAHYPDADDWRYQEALLAIHTHGVLLSPTRFRLKTREYHLRSQDEMVRAFRANHPRLRATFTDGAVLRTREVSERCAALSELPRRDPVVPPIKVLVGHTHADYLQESCLLALAYLSNGGLLHGADDKYETRLNHELATIEERGVVDYFLAVKELYDWAKQEGIMVGPGRGSVGGSLVAYLLGITQIDPIRHGLMFERFLAPGRCFPGETLVSTSVGALPIHDVRPGMMVWTRMGLRRVLARHARWGKEPGVKIEGTTSDGKPFLVRCTYGHRIFRRGRRKEGYEKAAACKLEVGDELLSCLRDGNQGLSVAEEKVLQSEMPYPFDDDSSGETQPSSRVGEGGERNGMSLVRPSISSQDWESNLLQRAMSLPCGCSESPSTVLCLWNGIQGREAAEGVLPEVWAGFARNKNAFAGAGRIPSRPGPFRAFRAGGGLRAFVAPDGHGLPIRGGAVSVGRRDDVLPRLLSPTGGSLLRIEGMAWSGWTQADLGEAASWRSPTGALSGRFCQEYQGGGIDGCPCGNVQTHQICRVQDDRSCMCVVWSDVPRPRDQESGMLLAELREQAAMGSLARATITSIRRIVLSGPVYDLSVEGQHEYFAGGILVSNSDLPDIDCDFASDQRDEVLAHLQAVYGADHFARISARSTMRGRQCLKDVGRVFQVPIREIEELIPLIPEKYITQTEIDEGGLKGPFENEAACRKFAQKYPPVVETALKLEGSTKALTVHPAGVVISPEPIVDVCPLESRESNGERVPVTALDMHGVEALGLVKLDILGLHNLKVIRDALEAIERRGKRAPDLTAISLNDPKVLVGFTRRNLAGIFQLDTPLAHRLCEGLKFESFEEVAILNALGRPGVSHSGLSDTYRKRKRIGVRAAKGTHPIVASICRESRGAIIYQEHMIRLLRELGGYTPEDADKVRKMVGKKHGKAAVKKALRPFVDGAISRGMQKREAEGLAEAMMHAGAYIFNKSVDIAQGVATADGEKPAGEIRQGDLVYVCGPRGARPASVRAVHDHGFVEALEATFDDGSKVTCSIGHRFLTNKGILSLRQVVDFKAAVAWAAIPSTSRGMAGDVLRSRFSNQSGEMESFSDLLEVSWGASSDSVRDVEEGVLSVSRALSADSIRNREEDFGSCGHSGAAFESPPRMAVQESREDRRDSCARSGNVGGRVASSYKVSFGGMYCRSSSGCETRRAGAMWVEKETGRFRLAGRMDRGGWAASLSSDFWGGAIGTGFGTRCDAQSGGGPADVCDGPDFFGLFHNGRSFAGVVSRSGPQRDPESAAGPYLYRRLVSIRSLGPRPMVDLEVDSPHLFALSNGIVSHNSHATAYGLIAYREMYLKTYFPTEFVWALLTHTPGEEARNRFVGEARRLRVRVLPPDVNLAGRTWGLDKRDIVAGLITIKGVGPAAVGAIVKTQPYQDFVDFAERVDRRRCHRGVALALLKAGALRALVPNEKWLHDNFSKVWSRIGKRGWQIEVSQALVDSAKEPDWTAAEAICIADEVCPIQFDQVRQ